MNIKNNLETHLKKIKLMPSKKSSKTLPSLKELDYVAIFFDLTFYILGLFAFYGSNLLLILPFACVLLLILLTSKYRRNTHTEIATRFTEFLNYINANLSIGMTFEHAILAYERDTLSSFDKVMDNNFKILIKAIKMNVSTDRLFEILYEIFPIKETKTFVTIISQSMKTGASQTYVVGITLDKLHIKQRTEGEIESILYQKKLEQSILCLAPMFIILFIKSMSESYFDVMYTTEIGRVLMTFSFALVILMKFFSGRIIKIEV